MKRLLFKLIEVIHFTYSVIVYGDHFTVFAETKNKRKKKKERMQNLGKWICLLVTVCKIQLKYSSLTVDDSLTFLKNSMVSFNLNEINVFWCLNWSLSHLVVLLCYSFFLGRWPTTVTVFCIRCFTVIQKPLLCSVSALSLLKFHWQQQ